MRSRFPHVRLDSVKIPHEPFIDLNSGVLTFQDAQVLSRGMENSELRDWPFPDSLLIP